MAHELTASEPAQTVTVQIESRAEIKHAAQAAKGLAASLGFGSRDRDEIVLAVTELASNLVKHAVGGTIKIGPTTGRAGIQIESEDSGPGIPDVEQALTDGYSTAGSLGTGLGTLNRLMHEMEIYALSPTGTRIVCQRWVRPKARPIGRWLEFGAATRGYQRQPENGDAFVIQQWEGGALAGVIDGLGHGPFAQRAAQAARQYLERHFDQDLPLLFRGVGRACSATRGVVMALARFDMARQTVAFANIGNVEVRLLHGADRVHIPVRRGVVGLNAPNPVVSEQPWGPDDLLIMHSDGLRTSWDWSEFRNLSHEGSGVIAQRLLCVLGKIEDDATVLVVRSAQP